MTSFLLKQSPFLNKLTLYDDKTLKPLEDIKFINTPCQVSFVNGREHMNEAIKTADIIIIGDDDPKGMSHEGTLMSRAPSFSDYVQNIAYHNSDAIIVVATNPVNMTVPLAAEVLRSLGKLDERKLIGMTNVENIKARSILAHHLKIPPGTIDFPVIGGLTPETSVPLLSNTYPHIPLSKANLQKITCAVKTSTTKLHTAGGSQESLNRAYATAKLVKSIVTGLNGQPSIETVLSYQKVINHAHYFSLPVLLGEDGVIDHISLPNISQREKYLLTHAIACMAADSKIAKKCYSKLTMNIVKPMSATQNKLNKLKSRNKQPQSQYSSISDTTQKSFQSTKSNEKSCSDMKLKCTMNHIASTIYSCNENIKKSMEQNNMKSQKPQINHSGESNIVSNTALLRKQDSLEVSHQRENQSEPRKNDLCSFIDNENINETEGLNQAKSINVVNPEIPTEDLYCIEKRNTMSTNLESDEPLLLKSLNEKENSANHYNLNSRYFNNHSAVTRSLNIDNIKSASECEKTLDEENAIFKFKSQGLTTPINEKNSNREQKIISIDPIVNFLPISVSPNLDIESNKCVVEEHKLSVKCNDAAKQYTTSNNMSTESPQEKFITENLEKISTSNVTRIVNEIENRIGISNPIRNQSEYIFDKSKRPIDVGSKCNTKNDKHFGLFEIRSTEDDKNLTINETDRDSITDTSFIGSNDTKTSGKKYNLHTNLPHWILQSMLFKSEKYQSSKLPILTRHVSSESRDNKIKNKTFTDDQPQKKIQTRINKSQESLWFQPMLPEYHDKEMKNKQVISSITNNSKKQVTSLQKSPKNIKSPLDTFLSRYKPSESYFTDFIGINSGNKIKQEASLSNLRANTTKQHESFRRLKEPSDEKMKKPHDEEMKYKEAEAFNSEEKVRQGKSLAKYQTYVNKSNKTIKISNEPESYDSPLPPPKFRSAKYYDASRKMSLGNSNEPNDTYVFDNLIQKQKNTISSGHKIASFKIEGSKDSFFVLQRKKIDSEMLEKVINHRNKRNDFQKLHLLTNNSMEPINKDKISKNEMNSSGLKSNYWENNNENLMANISNRQSTEDSEKNVDNVRHQLNSGNKRNNMAFKEGEREKEEWISITSNDSKKDFNADTLNTPNNQVTNKHFKYVQSETMLDRNELASGKLMSDINYDCVSKLRENGTCENNGDSNNNLKKIQHWPNLDSETNTNNTEGVKREKKSLERALSKESDDKFV